MIVLLATLLLAQAGAGQERKEVPMPDTAHPAANEHGATLGHQEAAPGAERKGEHGKGGEEGNIRQRPPTPRPEPKH